MLLKEGDCFPRNFTLWCFWKYVINGNPQILSQMRTSIQNSTKETSFIKLQMSSQIIKWHPQKLNTGNQGGSDMTEGGVSPWLRQNWGQSHSGGLWFPICQCEKNGSLVNRINVNYKRLSPSREENNFSISTGKWQGNLTAEICFGFSSLACRMTKCKSCASPWNHSFPF